MIRFALISGVLAVLIGSYGIYGWPGAQLAFGILMILFAVALASDDGKRA